MSKKILVFCGGFIVSGAEIVTLSYIKELLKMEYKVHFVISKWTDGELKMRLTDLKIPYTEVKLGFLYLRKPLWTLDSLIHYPIAVWHILNAIKNFKPDLTYHMSYRSLFMLKPFLKGKNFYHVHDAIPPTRWNKFILRSIRKITDKFVVVSHFTKVRLQNCGIDQNLIIIIHNGVIIPEIEVSSQIDYSNLRIGLAGQINRSKGYHLVIEALAEKRFANRKITLKIFGNGNQNYIEELKLLALNRSVSEQIEWCGFVNKSENLYSFIDFLIIPSINPETFGMVAIEAGVNKVLVLSAAVGGLLEIIKDKTTGYLFKNNDAMSIAETLDFALSNQTLNVSCIEANFKNVQENFNLSNQASILSDLFMNKSQDLLHV